jgi:hypothetical protein
LEYCFQALISRKPHPAELDVLKDLLAKQLNFFKENKQNAVDLLTIGEYKREEKFDVVEVAAYTIVASMIMNYDEFTVIR